jgi:hypothetical protein
MGYLFTDTYDQIILKRRVQQMSEVDRLLSMVESHFGVSLAGEQRVEEMLRKWGEKTKEESSTSIEAEEIIGETATHLVDCQTRQPRMPDSHLSPAHEREPTFPGR